MISSACLHVLPAAALLLTLAAAGQAHAACTASSSGLAFGSYQPLTFAGKFTSKNLTSTATVTVTCDRLSGALGYTLKLGPSPAGGSISPRYMSNSRGGDNMAFNLYTDTNYLSVWGDDSSGNTITHGALNGTFAHTVYGKIPANQNTLKAGDFTTTLIITLTYRL